MMKFTSAAKVLGIAILSAGSFMTAWAQQPTTSPMGTVNLTDFGEGVNGVIVQGNYTINRMFDGCVSMYRDGILIRQLPASNSENFYTFYTEGFNDVKEDNHQIQLIFDRSGMGIGSVPGEYVINMPAGIVWTDKDCTELNPEWNFNINCVGSSGSSFLVISPEPNKSYGELQTFTFTLPDDPKFRWGNTSEGITIEDFYDNTEAGEEDLTATVTVEGNVATAVTASPITKKSTYLVNIPAGFYMINQGTAEEPDWVAAGAVTAKYYVSEIPKGVKVSPDNSEPVSFFQGRVMNVQAGNVIGYKYVLFEVNMESTLTSLLKGRPAFYAVDSEGNVVGDPIAKFGTATPLRRPADESLVDPDYEYFDGHKFYVIAEEFAEDENSDPDGGNFMPAPGNYALVFPKATYFVVENGVQGQNAEFMVPYTVGVNPNFPFVIKPTDGYETNSLQYITVTFDEGNEIKSTSKSYAHLTNGICEYAMLGELTDGLTNEVTYALPIPMTTEGTWTFTTPTVDFTVNGMVVGVTATYIVKEGQVIDKTMAITPAPGKVTSLQVFNITFPAFPDADIEQEGGSIKLTNDKGEAINIPVKYYDSEKKCFVLDLEEKIVEAGNYALTIADNTLWVGDENGFINLGATFYYQVDGSESVEAIFGEDNAPAALYNAAGMILKQDATAEDINALTKGLYIYKGKKLIVK